MIDLKSEQVSERYKAIKQLAALAQIGAKNKQLLPDIALLINDSDERIAYLAVFTLVNFAENDMDISECRSLLAKGLKTHELKILKEIDWALYCIVRAGGAIDEAEEIYAYNLMQKKELRANAAIALALHYYNTENIIKAESMLALNSNCCFGVAWAATDYSIRTRNKIFVKNIASTIRAGIHDIDMHNGIAGALSWNKQQQNNIDTVVEAINELIDQTEDEMKKIKLATIFTKMQTVNTKRE